MPSGTLRTNESTPWFKVIMGDGVHMSFDGTFGGGTIAIEKEVNKTAYPLLNEGTAITYTVADDSIYNLRKGDRVRATLSGATAPALAWSIRGS